jgi:hypothetical protein
MQEPSKLPFGIKFIIGFHLVSFVLWLFGQTGAVVAYDTVAAWGLQEPRALSDPALVEVNRAIGLADTFLMLPLFIVAVVGLLRIRFYGAVASWLVFGMSLYWPAVFFSMQAFYSAADIRHVSITMTVATILLANMAIAGWGSWYLAKNRKLFH